MAGTSSRSDSGKKKARIEIIPLIDVIFFLLATFVLFTLSLDKIMQVPVTLPKAAPQQPTNSVDETTVNIQVSETGVIYWKVGARGVVEQVSPAEIGPRLTNLKNSEASPRVLIRGDNRAKFGAAVTVLDEVRKAEIQQVSVETVTSTTGR